MRKSSLSQKIRVKITEIFDQKKSKTRRAFASFQAILANQILENKNTFESYLYKIWNIIHLKNTKYSVSINELKDVLKLTITLGLTN